MESPIKKGRQTKGEKREKKDVYVYGGRRGGGREEKLTVKHRASLNFSGIGECPHVLALSAKQVQQQSLSSLSEQLTSRLFSSVNLTPIKRRTLSLTSGRSVRLRSVIPGGRWLRSG